MAIRIVEDRVWQLMANAGIQAQEDLAVRMGQHPVSVNRVVRGRTPPSIGTVDLLCRVLNAQPGDFLIYYK